MPTAGTPTAANEGRPFFSAVWYWDNSDDAYDDNTFESQLVGGTAFTVLEAATSDYLYMGNESRFDLAYFNVETAGSLGALTWAYWNGTSWVRFAPGRRYMFAQGIDPAYSVYDFSRDGIETFDNLVGWTACKLIQTDHGAGAGVAPPDSEYRYWIRVSAASVATAPTISNMRCRPYASYCTATDVSNVLQLDTAFSSSTTPTRNAVEDSIHSAQSFIDRETNKSWRLNYVANEYHEFKLTGFTPMRGPILRLLRVEVWNGVSWDTKTEGRNNDYFLEPSSQLILWSRFFLLPARFASTASSLGFWGWGEFVHPIRISYLYGSDIFTDEKEGGVVFDICRKLAAIDVWQSHDYSILSVSGADKVPLERKIDNWKEEVERKIDSLKAWVVM